MQKKTVLILFLIFTLVPLIELVLFVKIAPLIGFWRTIAIIIITGLGGAYLAKTQGHGTIEAIKQEISQGKFPAERLLDGAIILVGSVLLITPGFLTDAIGLLCMFPTTRVIFKTPLRNYIKTKFFGEDFIVNS
ncbi:MAG: FxsA family protein [Candidatus Cloacimonetes bacterium]|nr:FxsA family protein [Candidatus Cloacimonadota bacterium]